MIEMPLIIAAGLALLCAAIVYMDLRYMRIPDWISIAVIALFVVWVFIDYPSVPVLARLLSALIGFVICFILFAFRIMGGGDTKVLPTLLLFVPVASMAAILFLFAACLFLSVVAVVILRKAVKSGRSSWMVFTSHKLPMGLAIGTTGIIGLAASHL